MSVEPEYGFVSDKELKSLLERWVAPGPSRVLDKRIETSFAREFSGADRLSQSVLLTPRREEVVSMKFCSRCEEEFADKFSFCPVDGTPLTVRSAEVVEDPSLTVSQDNDPSVTKAQDINWVTPAASAAMHIDASGSAALVARDEYHLTIIDDAGLAARLMHEFRDVA